MTLRSTTIWTLADERRASPKGHVIAANPVNRGSHENGADLCPPKICSEQ